jgi:hypothetical protein
MPGPRSYIAVEFDIHGPALQEVEDGSVIAYRDLEGNVLEDYPPIAEGCRVTNPDPEPLPWMVFDA